MQNAEMPIPVEKGISISPITLLILFSLLLGGFLVFVFNGGDYLVSDLSVEPKKVFGEIPPAPLVVSAAFQVEAGEIGELVDPTGGTSISVVRSYGGAKLATLPSDLKQYLEVVKGFRLRGEESKWFDPFLLRYASAHFDGRRANYVGEKKLLLSQREASAVTFHVKHEQFFVMSLFDQGPDRVLVLAMRPSKPVGIERLNHVLESLPRVRG